MPSIIAPTLTLDAIYGDGLALCPRPFPGHCNWLPRDPVFLEMLTGGMLTVSGKMPVLCAASVSTREGLQLLLDAGFSGSRTLRFRDCRDHDRHRSLLLEKGYKLALQHAPPAAEKASENYWIDPELLRFLNHKGHLAELVEERYVPDRRKVTPTELWGSSTGTCFPAVLKVATCETTGGGVDVAICHSPDDFSAIRDTFRDCGQLIVEEFLPIAKNLCLNYAVSANGEITYIGSAEQITDHGGNYYGNWFEATDPAPAAAIAAGARVAKKGFDLGYYGCVGMDMAILKNGEIRIYDLNFRLNGSTVPLLLAAGIRNRYGKPVMRLTGLRYSGSFANMIDALYRAMHRGIFVPLVTCDPGTSGRPAEYPRTSGLILGETRSQIDEQCNRLKELNFEIPYRPNVPAGTP